MRSVGVLGGGMAGLAAALYLRGGGGGGAVREPPAVALWEAQTRVGGWVRSDRSPDGALWERGPRTLRPRGEAARNTLRLLHALGMDDEVVAVARSSPAARVRMVLADGELHALPTSALGLLRAQRPFTRPLAAVLLRDLMAPAKELQDESMYDFAARRFGEEVAEWAVSPLVCGVCAGDARQVSVRLLLRDAFEAEQRHGGVAKGLLLRWLAALAARARAACRGAVAEGVAACPLSARAEAERWAVFSLRGGLEALPRAVARAAADAGAALRVGTPVQGLSFESGGCAVRADGHETTVDHVVSALPASALAPLVAAQHPALAHELRAVPFANVAVANMSFAGRVLPRDAFGFLVPPNQGLPLLGVVFDSCLFPHPRGGTVLTAMLGGRWFGERLEGPGAPPPPELCLIAASLTTRALGVTEQPTHVDVQVLRRCIPQYVVGHEARVRRIREYVRAHRLPLQLCGASWDGVGLNDALLSARQAASAAASFAPSS